MTTPLAIWDSRFVEYDFGPGHPFVMEHRHQAAKLLGLTSAGSLEWIRKVEPASHDALRRFHRPEYIDLIERLSEETSQRTWLDGGDTPAFPGCHEAAARIAQGSLVAVEESIRREAPVFQPAGGLHHAHADRASGFCIYNDVALAVGVAHERFRRVAYLDIDAHHGDGVMYGFYDTGGVLDIDFHQDGRTLFPGTGEPRETGRDDGAGLKVNLPLPPGSGDLALTRLFRRVALPMLEEFRPEIIVLQHGVDGHAGDPLAQLQYTERGYRVVLEALVSFATRHCHGRLVVTGGGGYDPVAVARTLARTGRWLAGCDPTPTESTPAAWCSGFTAATGVDAPLAWADEPTSDVDEWSEAQEERLLASLEEGLGRRFPRER